MRKFSVFDNLGNKVGEFVPEGSEAGMGIVVLLGFLILFGIGWLVYQFFRLIIKGFVAVKEGDWNKAMIYFAVPSFLILCLVISALIQVAGEQRMEVQATQTALNIQREINDLNNNPPFELRVWRGECTGDEKVHYDSIGAPGEPCIHIDLTNEWDGEIVLAGGLEFYDEDRNLVWGNSSIWYAYLAPGQTFHAQDAPGWEPDDRRRMGTNSVTEICMSWYPEVASYGKHSELFMREYLIREHKVCQNVK